MVGGLGVGLPWLRAKGCASRRNARPTNSSLKPRPLSLRFGSVGVFVCAGAHVACFVVVVAVAVAVFVVIWANDNRGLAGWRLLSTLGSFQTPRQEILLTIAAVNWPIFLERG